MVYWHVQYKGQIQDSVYCCSYFQGTLNDYLEMFLQFGYVFLISSVFPPAALLQYTHVFTISGYPQ